MLSIQPRVKCINSQQKVLINFYFYQMNIFTDRSTPSPGQPSQVIWVAFTESVTLVLVKGTLMMMMMTIIIIIIIIIITMMMILKMMMLARCGMTGFLSVSVMSWLHKGSSSLSLSSSLSSNTRHHCHHHCQHCHHYDTTMKFKVVLIE